MNRKEFGQLLATLRKDMGWTQFQLAELVEIDEAVISQVERGVKKHYEPELLFSLANAFQLTTLERREFFLAASGLEKKTDRASGFRKYQDRRLRCQKGAGTHGRSDGGNPPACLSGRRIR